MVLLEIKGPEAGGRPSLHLILQHSAPWAARPAEVEYARALAESSWSQQRPTRLCFPVGPWTTVLPFLGISHP